MNFTLSDEAQVILRYLLGRDPDPEMAVLYVRGLQEMDQAEPLPLGPWVSRWPWLLWFGDVASVGSQSELRERLRIGSLVLECFSAANRQIYNYGEGGRVAIVLGLFLAVVVESVPMILRVFWRSFRG
jgi:hypothetical protein